MLMQILPTPCWQHMASCSAWPVARPAVFATGWMARVCERCTPRVICPRKGACTCAARRDTSVARACGLRSCAFQAVHMQCCASRQSHSIRAAGLLKAQPGRHIAPLGSGKQQRNSLSAATRQHHRGSRTAGRSCARHADAPDQAMATRAPAADADATQRASSSPPVDAAEQTSSASGQTEQHQAAQAQLPQGAAATQQRHFTSGPLFTASLDAADHDDSAAPHVVVFSGGTAFNSIARYMRRDFPEGVFYTQLHGRRCVRGCAKACCGRHALKGLLIAHACMAFGHIGAYIH